MSPQPIPTAAAVREEEPGHGGSGRPPAADGFILGSWWAGGKRKGKREKGKERREKKQAGEGESGLVFGG